MGILMRKDKEIRGIIIKDDEHKLFQYADDTGLFLDGSEKSLKKTLDLLEQFSKYSGLTPNFDKTKAIWIGSKQGSNERLCGDRKLSWINEPFEVLGIIFTTDLNEISIIIKRYVSLKEALSNGKKEILVCLVKL